MITCSRRSENGAPDPAAGRVPPSPSLGGVAGGFVFVGFAGVLDPGAGR